MSLRVRKVIEHETESTFRVLKRVAAWLEEQGRRQRIAKTQFTTYRMWQKKGVNYVVLDEDQIAGVFSLPCEPPREWSAMNIKNPVIWLRSLATDPAHRGKGVGAFAVNYAIESVSPAPLYLDCVSGFLPTYYTSLGFKIVASQVHTYPDEPHAYDITLMKYCNA